MKPDGTLLHILQVALDRANETGADDVARKIRAIIDDAAPVVPMDPGQQMVLSIPSDTGRTEMSCHVDRVEVQISLDGRTRLSAEFSGSIGACKACVF